MTLTFFSGFDVNIFNGCPGLNQLHERRLDVVNTNFKPKCVVEKYLTECF